MHLHIKGCAHIAILDLHNPFQPFHNDIFGYYYIWQHKLSIQHHLTLLLLIIMNVTDYWPMTREYSIWNAAVAALQFWTADPKAHVLSSTTEQVYNVSFYTTSTHLLCQQSEEVLFSWFVTTLNAAFESKLALEDEGYESGSEKFQHTHSPQMYSQNPPCIQWWQHLLWPHHSMQHGYQPVTLQTCIMPVILQ